MTQALILGAVAASDGTPAALLPVGSTTAVQRLAGQLRRRDISTAAVVTRPEWIDALRAALGPGVDVRSGSVADALAAADPARAVLLVDGHGVGHDAVAEWLVRDADSACLVDGSGETMGLLFVAASDRSAIAGAEHSGSVTVHDLAGALGAFPLRKVGTGPLQWALPRSAPEAAAAEQAAAADQDTLLLDAAVKSGDSFFPTFFVAPYSRYIARWAAQRGLTPNQITVASFTIGLAAAACFAVGSRAGLIAGALLLQASFTTDCVDGQVARYTRRFSPVGAWLDSTFDRLKEYLVYGGLAIGGIRTGGDDSIWVLAAAALTLQTVRHMAVFGYEERAPLAGPPRAKVAGAGVRALSRANRVPALRWAKRIVVLPIGERFALISVAAAISTPRTTLVWVLAWGGLATAYVLAGRLLRSIG